MLINLKTIVEILNRHNINITGAFHLGAHECEEIQFYNQHLKLILTNILWIEAMPHKVEMALNRHIPNVYNAIITDKDDEDITFNVSNNGQSSSVLNFKTHLQEHPSVFYVSQISGKSITIDTFFKRNNIEPSKYNFWNFDIQGAELMALKGATESMQHVKAIYLEVNEKELYENCALIGEIDDFLLRYNFQRVLTNMTQHGWGDALYIKQ
jgi:FkbM family methyltransferase